MAKICSKVALRVTHPSGSGIPFKKISRLRRQKNLCVSTVGRENPNPGMNLETSFGCGLGFRPIWTADAKIGVRRFSGRFAVAVFQRSIQSLPVSTSVPLASTITVSSCGQLVVSTSRLVLFSYCLVSRAWIKAAAAFSYVIIIPQHKSYFEFRRLVGSCTEIERHLEVISQTVVFRWVEYHPFVVHRIACLSGTYCALSVFA